MPLEAAFAAYELNLQSFADKAERWSRFEKSLPAVRRIPIWEELNANQRASLISFCYNVGVGFYRPNNRQTHAALSSTARLNDWADRVLLLWHKAGGVDHVLTTRREAEQELWHGRGPFAMALGS
ncbi:MAG: hypothetical protein MRY63_05740 [Neomegalonema sp.]|nr:hypothetical protein [Neomegalonema sp.]